MRALLPILLLLTAAPALGEQISPQGLLADLYRGKIALHTCQIDVSWDVRSDMDKAIVDVEAALGFDEAMKQASFAQMEKGVAEHGLDCSDHDRLVSNLAVAVSLSQQLQANREAGPIDILGGLYLTVAVTEYCHIQIDPPVAGLIGRDAQDLEASLGLTPEMSEERYQAVLARVKTSGPDCSASSNDLSVMRDVLTQYQDMASD